MSEPWLAGWVWMLSLHRALPCCQILFWTLNMMFRVELPAGQIGPWKGSAGSSLSSTCILENTVVLGVLRAATDKSASAIRRSVDARAKMVLRERQREIGSVKPPPDSSEEEGQ